MARYIVPLSGILMGVLVLGLILTLLHTKETAAAQVLQRGPGNPT